MTNELDLAREYLRKGNTSEAINKYNLILTKNKNNYAAIIFKALAQSAQGNLEAAIITAEEGLRVIKEIDPEERKEMQLAGEIAVQMAKNLSLDLSNIGHKKINIIEKQVIIHGSDEYQE